MTSDWLGGGLIVGLAAVLWLIYLLPTWFRRNEFNATERNVVRLQQTLRILAETAEAPDEVRAEASARSVVEHQRLLKKVTVQNTPPALRAAAKIRKARAVTSGILLLSVAVAVLGGVQTAINGSYIVLIVGLIAATLCVTRLGRLAKLGRAVKLPAAAGASVAAGSGAGALAGAADDADASLDETMDAAATDLDELAFDDADAASADAQGWTPVPLPKPLYTERRRLRQLSVGQLSMAQPTGAAASAGALGFAEQTAAQAEQALRAAAAQSELALRAGFAADDAEATRFAASAVSAEPVQSAQDARSAQTAASSGPTESVGSAGQVPAGIPSRFSAMGIVDEHETGSLDVDQVLARRRAG